MSNAPNHDSARHSTQINSFVTSSEQLRDRLLSVQVADLCDGLHMLRRRSGWPTGVGSLPVGQVHPR